MSLFRESRAIVGVGHVVGTLVLGVLVLVFLPFAIGGAFVVFVLWIFLGLIVGILKGSR